MASDEKIGSKGARLRDAEAEVQKMFEAAYDENGVDRSLIRYNLSLTVTDRVRAVENTLTALSTLRRVEPNR